MKVFISVVSHNHDIIIKKMNCLPTLAKEFNVVIKSNINDDLSIYCKNNNITHINSNYNLGFGANNNFVFNYCVDKLNMKDKDLFIIFNPDCYVSVDAIRDLSNKMKNNHHKLSTINLYSDKEMTIFDENLRIFPNLIDFAFSFLGLSNSTKLKKEKISKVVPVDWAHGSFLAFVSSHYKNLSGFDERYFMYCDDTDICLRSKLSGEPVYYYPEIKGIHLKAAASKNIFTKFFLYHLKSVFVFSYRRIFLK